MADRLYQDENAGWSWSGAKALADYMEEYEESMGEDMELDIVAIRCDFSEHESALDCVNDHGYDCDLEDVDEEDKESVCLEYLQENTTVIIHDDGIIIQGF